MGILHPNRMGPPGALSDALGGAALLLLSRPTRRAVLAAQGAGGIVCSIGLLTCIGSLYSVNGLYGAARYTVIAWPRRWHSSFSDWRCSWRATTRG